MSVKKLAFHQLNVRHKGVSPGLALSYLEAACVCLERHHVSPADFELNDNGSSQVATAEWVPVDSALRHAWANTDDATEFGAYGLALAAIELTRGLIAVRRAETRTGSDYYLGKPDQDSHDLEAGFRLEVSGTDGGDSIVRARLRQKLDQARQGRSNLPAIASVVGFAVRRILSEDLQEV